MALSLVPLEKIDDAWMEIDAESPSVGHAAFAKLSDLKHYFIKTWLENPDIYPRSLWNHYG